MLCNSQQIVPNISKRLQRLSSVLPTFSELSIKAYDSAHPCTLEQDKVNVRRGGREQIGVSIIVISICESQNLHTNIFWLQVPSLINTSALDNPRYAGNHSSVGHTYAKWCCGRHSYYSLAVNGDHFVLASREGAISSNYQGRIKRRGHTTP